MSNPDNEPTLTGMDPVIDTDPVGSARIQFADQVGFTVCQDLWGNRMLLSWWHQFDPDWWQKQLASFGHHPDDLGLPRPPDGAGVWYWSGGISAQFDPYTGEFDAMVWKGDFKKALDPQLLEKVEGLLSEMEQAISEAERPKGGMQVPFHGTFASAVRQPSIIQGFRWWVREIRKYLNH